MSEPYRIGRHRLATGLLLALGALALVWLRYRLPGSMQEDPKLAFESWAAQGGWMAIVTYGLVASLLGGVGLPPVLFISPMGLLWPVWVALSLAFLSGLGAAMAGFWIGRYAGGLLPVFRLPPRLARYEERLREGGIGSVVVLRLLFFLFPPLNWLLGMRRVRTSVYAIGTAIGLLPHTVFYVLTGAGGLPWLLRQPLWAIGGVATLIVGIVAWTWQSRGRT